MSFFTSVEKYPEDPIFGLAAAFKTDIRPNKVNLAIGVYKDEEGDTRVLSCVRKAEHVILEKNLNKEYLPIIGDSNFIDSSLKLIFGSNVSPDSIAGAQTLGGTGALRLGGDFLFQNRISEYVFLSTPTWPNHPQLFSKTGLTVGYYPYYDSAHNSLNFTALKESIMQMPAGRSAILLQPCCHNPTGLTPSTEQWKELSLLIKERQLLPFFDLAYMGFDQNLEKDTEVIRHFLKDGHEMMAAISFSKNLGLYGERTGIFCTICRDKETRDRAASQFKYFIRTSYSNPPLHGERIAAEILESESLKMEWENELAAMRLHIKKMRQALAEGLSKKNKKYGFFASQRGMFSLSGFNEEHVQRLRDERGVYMTKDGRVNLAGLNSKNIDYVIDSFLML